MADTPEEYNKSRMKGFWGVKHQRMDNLAKSWGNIDEKVKREKRERERQELADEGNEEGEE